MTALDKLRPIVYYELELLDPLDGELSCGTGDGYWKSPLCWTGGGRRAL